MAGNEHEVLAEARRLLGGLEFFGKMIRGELPNDGSMPICSATYAALALSRPRPPYASGISSHSRSSAPALRSSARVNAQSRSYSRGTTGSTSRRMKSAATWPNSFCSAVRSSRVNTSPGPTSLVRNLPTRG